MIGRLNHVAIAVADLGKATALYRDTLGATVSAPVPQPVLWTTAAARALLDYVQAIGLEGLDPATYSPDRLQAAIDSGDDAERNAAATPIFRRLMADLSGGYVRGDARVEWHMSENVIDPMRQQALLQRASQGEVKAVLDSLLPTHPQYAGLKAALASFTRGEVTDLTSLVYDAREHALGLIADEANAIGADDVVGIRTHIHEHGNLIEFMAIGTAVKRLEGLTTTTPQLPPQAIIRDKDTWTNVEGPVVREG